MSLLERSIVLTLAAMLAAGAACSRAADEARLETDLQTKLKRDLPSDLFELVGVKREGSAPLPAGETGAERVAVYFNATLRLARDYTFGEWDQLAPSSVAYVLGATEKGVIGLQAQNHAGDTVRAYGRAVYERTGDGWNAVADTAPEKTAAAPDLDGSGPPTRSKALIDKLAAMVNLPPPGVTPSRTKSSRRSWRARRRTSSGASSAANTRSRSPPVPRAANTLGSANRSWRRSTRHRRPPG